MESLVYAGGSAYGNQGKVLGSTDIEATDRANKICWDMAVLNRISEKRSGKADNISVCVYREI